MSMPVNLYFVRHGQSEANKAHGELRRGRIRFYTPKFLETHTSDIRLTELGEKQAIAAGEWLRANHPGPFSHYYVSDYVRAQETAALLHLPGARWYVDFNLRERDRGLLETLTQDELNNRYAQALRQMASNPLHAKPPGGGETMATVAMRVDRVFGTLHRGNGGGDAIIVAHGELIEGAILRLERKTQRDYLAMKQSDDPLDAVWNGQIIQYSRTNPDTGIVEPYLDWVRAIRPLSENSATPWKRITRRTFSNDELLDYARKCPRIFDDIP
jgi:broad specificity phosphatase PhoE